MKKILVLLLILIIANQLHAQDCPTTKVTHTAFEKGKISFSAGVKGGAFYDLSYNWSVSAGTIISGQGTPTILVALNAKEASFVTATVDFGGLPSACSSTDSATAYTDPTIPEKIIYGYFPDPESLTEAVKEFIWNADLSLKSFPDKACVLLYKGPNTTDAQLADIKSTISKAFEKNNINSSGYIIEDAGPRKDFLYEIYYQKKGQQKPKPSREE